MSRTLYRKYPHLDPAFKNLMEMPRTYNRPVRLQGGAQGGMSYRDLKSVPNAGGSRSSMSRASSGRSALGALSDRLSGGPIIDLNPGEWSRIEKELSTLSRSQRLQWARRIVSAGSRMMLPLRVLQWAMDIIDLLTRLRPTTATATGPVELVIPAGWSIYGRCPTGGPPAFYISGLATSPNNSLAYYANVCLPTGALTPVSVPLPATDNSAVYMAAGGSLKTTVLYIWRPMSGPHEQFHPYYAPSSVNYPAPSLPSPMAFFNPDLVQPGQAAPSAFAPPVATWNRPQSSFAQGRKVGYSIAEPAKAASVDPENVADVWTIVAGGGAVKPPRVEVVPREPPNDVAPMRRREKKAVIAPGGRLRKILDIIGDSADVIDVFWKAIPAKYRTRDATVQQKLEDIWEHAGRDDQTYLARVLGGLAVAEVEDWAYGQLGKASARASQAMGRPVGVMTGPAFRGGPPVWPQR